MTNQIKFTCECPRCGSTGRFDRGECFECKGGGYVSRSNTRHLTPFTLNVTYENGSKNSPRVFASRKQNAIAIVERMLRIKGWKGTVS